jgi:hypothetical protein
MKLLCPDGLHDFSLSYSCLNCEFNIYLYEGSYFAYEKAIKVYILKNIDKNFNHCWHHYTYNSFDNYQCIYCDHIVTKRYANGYMLGVANILCLLAEKKWNKQ